MASVITLSYAARGLMLTLIIAFMLCYMSYNVISVLIDDYMENE
jgi:hypothetical protein